MTGLNQSPAHAALIEADNGISCTLGVWDLFAFGRDRYLECLNYGFGTPESLGRVLLVGYTQYDGQTSQKLSSATRQRMRNLAAGTGNR